MALRFFAKIPIQIGMKIAIVAIHIFLFAQVWAASKPTRKTTPVDPALIQNSVVRATDAINVHSDCPNQKRLPKSLPVKTRAAAAVAKPIAPVPPPVQAPPPPPPSLCESNSREPLPATKIKNVNGAEVQVSTISLEQANQAFQYVDKQKRRYMLDSKSPTETVCRARAHLVALDLARDCRVKSAKIFVQGSRTIWSMYSPAALEVDARGAHHRWDNYHVANVIMVDQNGTPRPFVVDPVLFDHAVPLGEWKDLLKKADASASFTVTSPSNYSLSDAGSDDPKTEPFEGQSKDDIDKAKSDYRKMNSP